MEDKIIKGEIPNNRIEPAYFEDKIDEIYEGYYQRLIDKLDPSVRKAAQLLIEEDLIYHNEKTGDSRRESRDSGRLLDKEGITQKLLNDLESNFLLRREVNSLGGISYEVSHDTLIAPILKSKKERKEVEEQERLKIEEAKKEVAKIQFEKEAEHERQRNEELQKAFKEADYMRIMAEANFNRAEAYSHQADNERIRAIRNFRISIYVIIGTLLLLAITIWQYFETEKANYKAEEMQTKIETAIFEKAVGTELKYLDSESFEKIEKIDLSYNGLTRLPKEIRQCKNLKILNLQGNRFLNLNEVFEVLSNLNVKALSLSLENMNDIPPQYFSIIQDLDLRFGNLISIPSEIWQLTNLQILDLGGNKITQIPTEIVELKNLKCLKLGGNNLTSIPLVIGQLQNLQVLYLGKSDIYESYNQIKSIPTEIWRLKNLKDLDLSGNSLKSIGAEISELRNLEKLDLSYNQLTSIPKEIWQLKNLKNLNLNNNNLNSIEAEISELKDLETLNLSYNQLTNIQIKISRLRKLKGLNLSNNKLTILNPTFCVFKDMGEINFWGDEGLDISKNPFKEVPECLKKYIQVTSK